MANKIDYTRKCAPRPVQGGRTMTDAEARAILNSYGAPVNIAKHIEAINTAIRALGGKATMAEIWAWAKQPAELEVENGKT